MTKWMQYTYVNGKFREDGTKEMTADEMLEMMAQMHFLKQAGEDIYVSRVIDEKSNLREYGIERNTKDGKEIMYRFVKK